MPTLTRPHLLLVDDDESVQNELAELLTWKGYEVTAAAGVAEAERLLGENTFHAVILAIMLPDGNGLEFLGRVKTARPDLPVIILTGLGFQETLFQQAQKLGANGYVSKTLPPFQVLMEVRHALRAKNMPPAPGQVSDPDISHDRPTENL